MPGLKRFIPNRLSREKTKEPCSPIVEEEKSRLKRANARLHKRNQSSINILSGLGIVHSNLPIRDDVRFSRQNSFEPGQSLKDFDISPFSENIELANKASGLRPLILPALVASRDVSPKSPVHSRRHEYQEPDVNAADVNPAVGRYGLDVHPDNLAIAAARSVLARRAHSRSNLSVSTLKVVNGDPEPELESPEESAEDALAPNESDQDKKANVPAIGEIDWAAISEEEVRQIAKAYGAATALSAEGSSPADSAIALSRRGSSKRYSGKGKGRQGGSGPSSRTASAAVDAWVESQALINDGLQPTSEVLDGEDEDVVDAEAKKDELQMRGSIFGKIPNSWSSLESHQKERAEILDAMDDDQSKLQANACEIENLRILEQLELRQKMDREMKIKAGMRKDKLVEDIRQAEIEEERLREAQFRAEIGEERLQEELKDLNRREDELLEQVIREIEEEQRLEKERAQEMLEQVIREIEEENRIEEERHLAREARERARQKECCVCGDSKDLLDFHIESPSKGCEHPPNTCKECLQSWMASEFDTKGCDGIKCPECAQTLEYNEVQHAASAETFEAYDKFAFRMALGGLDEFAWCLAVGCGSGQMNMDNNHFMDCISCGYKQCLNHKVAWHAGETCEQYEYRTSGQKRRDEEKKEEEMLNTLSKKCPGPGCGWRIQKIDGCEHMTCKKCKFEFCWQCLASHAEIKRVGNTAHEATCKFHSTNLDLTWPFNMH